MAKTSKIGLKTTKTTPISESRSGLVTCFATWRAGLRRAHNNVTIVRNVNLPSAIFVFYAVRVTVTFH